MFTGLVEIMGRIVEVQKIDSSSSGGGGFSITIGNCAEILVDCQLGDSIAVNGVCLTVTEFTNDQFKVGVSPETLRKTNLGEFKEGQFVDLERAVKGDGRYGGHFVQVC
jgi:riboflavin synthase